MAIAASTKVRVRLPNSMTPWTPSSPWGTYDRSVQRGQVGQPRPEAVSRTAPPVTTIPMLATRLATASAQSARGRPDRTGVVVSVAPTSVGSPGRGEGVSTDVF